jgi:hypothetical protein
MMLILLFLRLDIVCTGIVEEVKGVVDVGEAMHHTRSRVRRGRAATARKRSR